MGIYLAELLRRVQWPGISSLEMLGDHVETVIRVIEGTIKGRRSYIYMDGNHSLQINGYYDLKKGKSETWETFVQFEPILSCGVPYSTLHIRTLQELLGVFHSNYL